MQDNLESLKLKLENFEKSLIPRDSKQKSVLKRMNDNVVFGIFVEILGGLIFGFLLNKGFSAIFGYNKFFFTLFLLFGVLIGLWSALKIAFKNVTNMK